MIQTLDIMKHLLIAIVVLFSITTVLAQPAADKITVTVKSGKFTIDKANVTDGWRQDAVSMALGINDRRRAGFNTTHTYDDYGIVLFETTKDNVATGVLSELQFFIAAGDTNAVTPKGLFKGKMQIEKLKISSNLSWKAVKEKLKGFKQTESYMDHNYRLAYKGCYFYFQFDDDETTLWKISIGKDKNP